MQEKSRYIIIFIFALIGLGLSLELCNIYYNANFNPYALGSFCSVSEFIDCDGVAKTAYSQFFGVPLSLWGVIFYLFIILMLFAKKLANIRLFKFMEVFKNPISYIFSLSLPAFLISMSLAFISIAEIEKVCVLCFATYIIDFAVALIAKDFKQPLLYEIKQSFSDFVEAIKIKKYLISFLAVVLCFAGVLTYTTKSKILTPQTKVKTTKISLKNVEKNENSLGNENAKVILKEYMDYNCASCFLVNTAVKRLMTELDDLYVIQYNFPLDKECNPLVMNGGHKGSCTMAKYAIAAKKQGKYWEANEILFDQQPNTEQKVLKALSKIKGIDKKKLEEDANSEEVLTELKNEIDAALEQKIEATPTIIVNMEKMTGNYPYSDLKEKMITLGAVEKSAE